MTAAENALPPVARRFQNQSITLLQRLCHWPAYEMTRQQRHPEYSRWIGAVRKRRLAGAARRVLFVHGQLPGETGSGVYMQQIAAESIRRGVDLHLLSAGGEPRPEDRKVYARNLADGMADILGKTIGEPERMRIAEAMRPLSWGRLVESLSGICDRLVDRALADTGAQERM